MLCDGNGLLEDNECRRERMRRMKAWCGSDSDSGMVVGVGWRRLA